MFTFFSYTVSALIFFGVAIAISIIWALLPGFLAKSKGRSFWGFFFLGILSPLVVSIIVLCLKDRTADTSAEKPAEAETSADLPEAEDAAPEAVCENTVADDAAVFESESVSEQIEEASDEAVVDDAAASDEVIASDEVAADEAVSEEATASESESAEKKPANKNKKRILITVIVSVIAIAAISVCCFFGVKYALNSFSDEPIFDADGAYGQNDVTALSDYSVLEAAPFDVNMRTVVAVDHDGNPAVTNADMQIWYWYIFNSIQQQYGQYAIMLGLDYNTPLAQQSSPDDPNMTWEQKILETAILNKESVYAMAQAAYANGYEISEEDQEYINDLTNPDGNLAQNLGENGFESPDAYFQAQFGKGVCVDNYIGFVKEISASSYQNELMSSELEAEITDDAISAYYDTHAEEMEANHILKVNNVSVRHILISPEGDPDPETGEYSEEAWAAAEEKANEIYAQWEKDPTEDNFAALATEYSADGGSTDNGGLYENFGTSDMVEEFSDWSFDQSREYGDTGIVKTAYGYHIMFFVEQTNTQGWVETCKEALVNEMFEARVNELCAQYPLQFDYTKIRLFDRISEMLSAIPETVASEETVAATEG